MGAIHVWLPTVQIDPLTESGNLPLTTEDFWWFILARPDEVKRNTLEGSLYNLYVGVSKKCLDPHLPKCYFVTREM